MAIIGYARVSTTDQDEALQVDDLQAAGADRLFIDKVSGVSARPELEWALDYARSGDVFLVWRLDRLGRSTPATSSSASTPCGRAAYSSDHCENSSTRPHPHAS